MKLIRNTSENSEEAAAVFAGYLPKTVNLFITDVDMPKMNGCETVTAIRNLDPSMKVILTNGMLGILNSEKVKELNIQGHITKPYTTHHLLQLIHDVITSPLSLNKES